MMTLRRIAALAGALLIAAALFFVWNESVTGVNQSAPSPAPGRSHVPGITVTPVPGPARPPSLTATPKPGGHVTPARPGSPRPSSPTAAGQPGKPGQPGKASQPGKGATTAPPFVPTASDLQAALLTAAQVPGGTFTPVPSQVASLTPESIGGCAAFSAGGSGVTAERSAFYEGGSQGPFVQEGLIQDSVSGASQMVAALTGAAQSCGSFPVSIEGLSLVVTLKSEPLAAVGDQRAALAVSISAPGSSQVIRVADIVAVRHGGTVIEVTVAAFPFDEALTGEVVAAAVQKVVSRW